MKLSKFFTTSLTTLAVMSFSYSDILTITKPPIDSASLTHNGTVISRNRVLLNLPDSYPQDNDWSCGPHSGARVLRFYGYKNADYRKLSLSLLRQQNIPALHRFGTAPHELINIMSSYAGKDVKLQRKASFNDLVNLISQGKPVITLVKLKGGHFPTMHWWIVDGIDKRNRKFHVTDTNNSKRWYSYNEFRKKWDWKIGEGAAKRILKANGLELKTMVWIDRVPLFTRTP